MSTGDTIWQAKQKCPSLTVVPPDFERYMYFSGAVRHIYSDYTDMIEPFGMDECWIDVSGSRSLFGKDVSIADDIRNRVRTETGLTISVGVSFCKVFAKIGSDIKKPDAVTVIDRDHFRSILWPMPVNTIIGVGPATEKRLSDLGIYTLGDLASASPDILKMRLGKSGEQLWRYANGDDPSAVAFENQKSAPKSIGRSITCTRDLHNVDDVFNVMLGLSEDVATLLRAEKLSAGGISIHMRTADLEVQELQATLSPPTQLASVLADKGIRIFKSSYRFSKPLRSVGIRAINLKDEKCRCQLSLFDDNERELKSEAIEKSMDDIRGKYGKGSIVRACTLLRPTPDKPFRACFNNIIE